MEVSVLAPATCAGSVPVSSEAVGPISSAETDARDALLQVSDLGAVDVGTGDSVAASMHRRQEKLRRKEERRARNKEWVKERSQKAKKRRREVRYNFLGTMDPDERKAFVAKERAERQRRREVHQASLQRAFESGAPKVVINCSFAESMNVKEHNSLAKQIQNSFVHVRDMQSSIQLHVTSMDTECPTLSAMEKLGYKKWPIHFHEETVWDLFPSEQLVVLSPDAVDELEVVDKDTIYVIGGLVDNTVKKRESFLQAEAHGVRHQKINTKLYLPGAPPVLNIDSVVKTLAERLLRPDGDWADILKDSLPLRHQGGPTGRTRRKMKGVAIEAKTGCDAVSAHDESRSSSESVDAVDEAL